MLDIKSGVDDRQEEPCTCRKNPIVISDIYTQFRLRFKYCEPTFPCSADVTCLPMHSFVNFLQNGSRTIGHLIYLRTWPIILETDVSRIVVYGLSGLGVPPTYHLISPACVLPCR